jgi:hypothetical protein
VQVAKIVASSLLKVNEINDSYIEERHLPESTSKHFNSFYLEEIYITLLS